MGGGSSGAQTTQTDSLLTRSEQLVFTNAILNDAYEDNRPQALGGPDPPPDGAPPRALSALGYRQQTADSVYAAGWYADTLVRAYDVQDLTPGPSPARGFMVGIRDPLGNETSIIPDEYQLVPASARNAAGLETVATHNYRVGRPGRVVDPNDTQTEITYHALGLVGAVVVVDRDGRGGTRLRPEVTHTYDLRAFLERRQPIFARTRRRIWHASDAVSDDVIESREYSDGLGRLLQTHVQADDLAFGAHGDAADREFLKNSSFDDSSGTGPTRLEGTSRGGPSAAADWGVWNDADVLTTTEQLPTTRAAGSGTMVHVTTGGDACGLVQAFLDEGSGPAQVQSSAWVFVIRGTVQIGTGNGGNTGGDALSRHTGQWELLSAPNGVSPANELIIYSRSSDGAEFYVDEAAVRVEWSTAGCSAPEPRNRRSARPAPTEPS